MRPAAALTLRLRRGPAPFANRSKKTVTVVRGDGEVQLLRSVNVCFRRPILLLLFSRRSVDLHLLAENVLCLSVGQVRGLPLLRANAPAARPGLSSGTVVHSIAEFTSELVWCIIVHDRVARKCQDRHSRDLLAGIHGCLATPPPHLDAR